MTSPAPRPLVRDLRDAPGLQVDAPLALLAATALIYLATIHFTFVYDDVRTLPRVPNQSIAGLGYWLTEWTFDRQTGQSAGAYHFVNVLIHLVNGTLLWQLLRRLGESRRVALAAMGIFLLHPLQVETVAYVTARADQLVAVGFLIACLGITARGGAASAITLAVGVFLCMLAKPTGVLAAIPLVLVVIVRHARPTSRAQWQVALLGTVLVATAGTAWSLGVWGWDYRGWWPWSWASLQANAVAAYLLQVVVPIRITADPGVLLLEPTWVIEILTVAGAGWLAMTWHISVAGRWLIAWVVACVGWRIVLPHSEPFGGPGDGYLLFTGVSAWLAVVVDHLWSRR